MRTLRQCTWILTAGSALLLLLPLPAHALRCGQKLIAEGDHVSRVLRFCGEPLSIESRFVQQLYVGDVTTAHALPALLTDVRIEEWTYNFGPNRLMRIVTIENGRVIDIRTSGYGFLP